MTTSAVREHVSAFDVMRTVAATAVVVIHVLGPYRDRLGEIPDSHWMSAIALNGMSRWCIPVFIMITGALLLSDPRPLKFGYFLRRRVAKVLIPFLVWSVLYAVVAGLSLDGHDAALTTALLKELPTHETYYHLAFFYYFIPLYLLIPVLKPLADAQRRGVIFALTAAWLVLTVLYLFEAEGIFGIDLVMYGGYLLLGYVLFTRARPSSASFASLALLGLTAVAIADYAVISTSLDAGRYHPGDWFSYKTVNTVLLAAFVFAGVLAYDHRLSARTFRLFEFVGRHSLGVYLIHPLFLWPVRAFDLYYGHPLLMIPFWTFVCGGAALTVSWLLRRHRVTAWLVP